ncbi:secretogranin-1 [Anomaloglossus baeobatrachus]|uniref:secretogranin-1 n=1 Tax=Anomaloglossus baeobatrachus TaxID=238106 RepID=UPI003F4F96FF
MPPVFILLSLLVGTLEVHAAPLDKRISAEEMVTRCIVEVLSNALAKPNAPPIDPECKEILKKSSPHRLDEKEDLQKEYETRNIKDFGNMDEHQHESNEEVTQSRVLPEEENEEKRHHEEDESKEEKEEEEKHLEDKEESTGHSKERVEDDDNDDDDDGGDEERGDHKNHNEKEEMEKKGKYHPDDSHEVKHDIFDEKVHQTAKSVEELSEDEEPNHLEEIMKRHHVSQGPKEPLFHLDKYPSAHSDELSEESDEREEERKRSYNPKHDDFVRRLLDYEERRSVQEQRNHPPSGQDSFHYRGQKPNYGQDFFENHLKNGYKKRTYHERESSEESREKRYHHQGSDEEKEIHDTNDESNERELMGHHYEDRHHLEIKRWPSQKNAQLHYKESNEDSEESNEDTEKRHVDDRLEKEQLYKKLKHHLQDSEEEKQEDKRHYLGNEMVNNRQRYFPELSYESNIDEPTYPGNDKHKRRHSEEDTRSFSKYATPDDPFRWKSRYFENNDNSEEERKRNLQTKNLFPEYDDYDLWGKKQLLDDINHEYGEKRNPLKIPKFEEKRQYDRMDELAQLLNYKKKSVEFPDFYDSEEIKKRHYNERSRLHQSPLTEEEEKELENLALMDLELQKIAEKLSNNRPR